MPADFALTPEDAEFYKTLLTNIPHGDRETTLYSAVGTIATKYEVPVYKVFDVLGELLGRSPGGISSAYYRSRRETLTSAGGLRAEMARADIAADFELVTAALGRIMKHVERLESDINRYEADQERFQEVRALLTRPAP